MIKALVGLIVVVVIGAMGAGSYFLILPKLNKAINSNRVADQLFGWKFPIAKFPMTGANGDIAYSNIRDPGGVPQGLPVRLKIPVIGVDTAIEDALITSDGRMDVPAGSVNVAWFALGPHPGKEGSAVIGGHYGMDNGKPKVFYNLNKLKAGDKVYVVDDRGDTLAFIVRSTKTFDRDGDSTTVFTSNDKLAHLNIITCEGVWNQVNDTYPQRLVIFTDAIPSEGAVITIPTKPVVKPSLPSTAKTKPAVTPPAKSVPPVPVDISSEKTATPSSIKNQIYPQTIIPIVKSLYSSSWNGIISSLLILTIIFVTYKIIRR